LLLSSLPPPACLPARWFYISEHAVRVGRAVDEKKPEIARDVRAWTWAMAAGWREAWSNLHRLACRVTAVQQRHTQTSFTTQREEEKNRKAPGVG